MNTLKTYFILAFLFTVIILLGLLIVGLTGNINYLWSAIIISVTMNFVSYFYSDKIALSISGAKPIEEYLNYKQQKEKNIKEDSFINKDFNRDNINIYKNVVRDLSAKNNMPEPSLYIIEDSSPNAFATGRNEDHAAIAVTTGLLSMMSNEELAGVLAHELSHIKNKDILIMSVVVVAVSILSLFSQTAMHLSAGSNRESKGSVYSSLINILSVVVAILMPVASMIIQASISQKREYMADASGAILAENSNGLISALKKLGSINMPLEKANVATAHMYISNPFGNSDSQSFLQRLFMTHPPIEERIAALEKAN